MNSYSIDLKTIMLNLLDDSDVQEKLLKTVHNLLELEGYKQKYEAEKARADKAEKELSYEKTKLDSAFDNLNKELRIKDDKINELNQDNENKKDRILGLENDISALKKESENKLADVKSLLDLKENIDKFLPETREFIDELAGGDDVVMHMCLGRSKKKIEQLWTYIKDIAVRENSNTDEIKALAIYFDYTIKMNNRIQKDNPFNELDIEIGGMFDSSRYIKTTDSCLNGHISVVLVKGYEAGGDYCFKPIVRVE